MSILMIIICLVIAVIVGVLFGIKITNKLLKREDDKLRENAEKFTQGKIKNSYNYDGEEYPANNFKLRNKDNEEKTIKFPAFE